MVAGGGRTREGTAGEFGMGMHILLYLKWITNKDLLCSTEKCAQYYVVAWREGGLGGKWLNPVPVHLVT